MKTIKEENNKRGGNSVRYARIRLDRQRSAGLRDYSRVLHRVGGVELQRGNFGARQGLISTYTTLSAANNITQGD
jgi:hypothetical protein